MKDSITKNNKNLITKIIAILFWVMVWQLVGTSLSNKLLLPLPFTVIKTLITLMGQRSFYSSVTNTFIRIISGFSIGCIIGVVLSILSYNNIIIRTLLGPLISVIKATPIASIIIVTLIWISSSNLSIFISFLMVLPPIYTNMLKGLDNTDKKMLEMTTVFKVKRLKKIRYIFIPSIKPYFVAATTVALGFCWKAGIAAEVIGLPSNTVGEALYNAKIYLNTPELFAWTLFIVLISVAFEKIFVLLMNKF